MLYFWCFGAFEKPHNCFFLLVLIKE